MDTRTLTLAQARRMLDVGDITAVALAELFLADMEARNTELNAYLEVFDDIAAQAARADEMIARGDVYPMTGIPIAIKDNILIKGRIASGASKILANYTATYDAHVIEQLKNEGAVLLGRTNMDEFALGSSTENSAYGPTKNPHDTTRIPGGTSGGSAAAVAGGIALAALGSDTGGSIRQPAALCGIVGFKPTYGAVSRYGVMAAASSLDQIGPLARTVEDAQMLFESIRGHDTRDATSLPDDTPQSHEHGKRIGVPRAMLAGGVDADVRDAFEASLDALTSDGYEIVDIDLPLTASFCLAAYYIVNPAEVSTNLARYDGIRYGVPHAGENLIDDYKQTRGKGFGPESRRRILIGSFVLSSGYADAYYRKAEAVRNDIRNEFKAAFEDVDVIAMPTSPTPAFKIGERADDPLAMYAADIFTVPINMTGVPAISVPMGRVERDGAQLPVGMQFVAPHNSDAVLFSIGKDFERIKG